MTREEFFELPLDEFIMEAIKQNEFPPQDGTWRSPLWEFTRWMRARSEFSQSDAYTAATEVEKVLRQLCGVEDDPFGEQDSVDPWEYHFGKVPGIDDPRAEFIETWDRVRTPANMDVLTVAWRAARQLPLRPKHPMSPTYCDLISIAGHLQRARPGQPIALPVERLAEILRCSRQSVGTYLRFAVKDGLLTKVSECVPHQRAAEFKLKTDRFDWSSGKQVR